MDFNNFAKSVEEGIYDVMMWILFYPLSLLRIIVFPVSTLRYVEEQSRADPSTAFSDAMRPALLLFLSIAIGALLVPINAQEAAVLQQTRLGKVLVESWFALLIFRMVVYSIFALAGAVIYDLLTPGKVTRETLRTPFNQQCYICAPFALTFSALLVQLTRGESDFYIGMLLTVLIWFVAMQFLFFRRFMKRNIFACLLLALAVLLIGAVGLEVVFRVAFSS